MKLYRYVALTFVLAYPLLAEAPDVSGLTLGITFDQAKAKLGPEFHSTGILKSPQDPTYQEMVLTRNKNGSKDGYILDALDGKIWQIVRTSTVPPNQLLGEDGMRKQVEEKYGSPTYDEKGLAKMQWDYGSDSKVVHDGRTGNMNDPCFVTGGRMAPPMDIGIGALLPTQYRGDCGVVLQIAGIGGRSDHTIESFQVYLIDNRPFYSHLHALQEEAAKKAKDAKDAAQKRTTPM